MADPSGLSSPPVCPDGNFNFTTDQLALPFPKGLATDTILPDMTTLQMPENAIQSYVNVLIAQGSIPATPIDPGSGLPNTAAMATQDSALQSAILSEYCYYESRYLYALRQFLNLATSGNDANNAQAKVMLMLSKSLNLKLNSLLEITNLLSKTRTLNTDALQSRINTSNTSIQATTATMNDQYKFLSRDNALLETQKEMIRYTKEKNEQVINQIALFTIMNAFAIGAIFAIVRS